MKLGTTKFKSGGLHEKHVVATWDHGNHLSILLLGTGKPTKTCVEVAGRIYACAVKPLWHFESKERLGEVRVCCIKEYTNRMPSLIKMSVVSSILFGLCLFTCHELFLSDPYHLTLLGLRYHYE